MNFSRNELHPEYLRIQRQIALTVATRPRAAGTNRLPVPMAGAVPIGHLVRGYLFPDVAAVTPAGAESAIREIIAILKRKGILLHGARWLGGRAYYAWLRQTFLQLPAPTELDPERPVEYHFTDLVPDGVDNIFRTLDLFLSQLFRMEGLPNSWWVMAVDTPPGEWCAAHARYLAAWQAAFLALDCRRLRPALVHDLATGGVCLEFDLDLHATFEDRSRTDFEGRGQAWLLYVNDAWRLTGLSFPGFRLPV